ncbi:MAG: 6,7-dimethyl-8-ribityllumazine synthase [Candidatus Bipolaricaulia bacterium]
METYQGTLDGNGLKIGIVVSRFNELITEKLLSGAVDRLTRSGVREEDIDVAWVPGSFELPKVVKTLAESGRYDGIISLGAVIRGGTPHFEYIATMVSTGLATLNLEYDTPIAFGVLTTDTVEQAIERAGTKHGNKGTEAAESVLEMVNLLKQLKR